MWICGRNRFSEIDKGEQWAEGGGPGKSITFRSLSSEINEMVIWEIFSGIIAQLASSKLRNGS